MNTTNVAIVNGISLQVVADGREQLVAVKPVCVKSSEWMQNPSERR